MACEEPVRISWAHRRRISYQALVIVVLIALASYSRASSGPWIIGLVLFWVLATFVVSVITPAEYERGYEQPHVTFVGAFLGAFVSVFATEFMGFLAAYVMLGAKPQEVRELLDIMSVPLAWLSPQFLIRPEKSFVDVCGVMLGNSFLLGIPIFLCVTVVQWAMRRNRAVQMGIEYSVGDEDE